MSKIEKISPKERIFHMVLFEALALLIMFVVSIIFTDKPMTSAGGLAISLSLIAMGWNYIYNLVYDYFYGYDRHNRSFKNRLAHGIGFEFGMVILSFPVIMFVLETDFVTTLLVNIGFVIFFILYAIAFNWCYDMIKLKMTA